MLSFIAYSGSLSPLFSEKTFNIKNSLPVPGRSSQIKWADGLNIAHETCIKCKLRIKNYLFLYSWSKGAGRGKENFAACFRALMTPVWWNYCSSDVTADNQGAQHRLKPEAWCTQLFLNTQWCRNNHESLRFGGTGIRATVLRQQHCCSHRFCPDQVEHMPCFSWFISRFFSTECQIR